jgi:hypothetical protein
VLSSQSVSQLPLNKRDVSHEVAYCFGLHQLRNCLTGEPERTTQRRHLFRNQFSQVRSSMRFELFSVGNEDVAQCDDLSSYEQVVAADGSASLFKPSADYSVGCIGGRLEGENVDRAKDRFDLARETWRSLPDGATYRNSAATMMLVQSFCSPIFILCSATRPCGLRMRSGTMLVSSK